MPLALGLAPGRVDASRSGWRGRSGAGGGERYKTRALEEKEVGNRLPPVMTKWSGVEASWRVFVDSALNTRRGSEQCGQANKGVWGMSWHQKAKGRGRLRKVRGSCQTSFDPGTPEPTQGTETSHYLEEEKENSIPSVAASERGGAQTRGNTLGL